MIFHSRIILNYLKSLPIKRIPTNREISIMCHLKKQPPNSVFLNAKSQIIRYKQVMSSRRGQNCQILHQFDQINRELLPRSNPKNTKEYQQSDMKKIADTVEGLFTKISYQEHLTIICVSQKKQTGTKQSIRNEMLEIYMELNLIANFKVAIQILLFKVSELQYDLYMRVDSNTNGHRQWFYFSMKNQKKCKVKLHIYRFKKQYSLFQRGMRPYFKSRKQGKSWRPGGQNIVYHYQRQRNDYGVNKDIKNFVLTFNYTFQHQNDEVFVAAGIPYSYSFLQKQLILYKEQTQKRQSLSFQITNLGKSMCGLDLPLITIQHKMSRIIHKDKKKRFIIINTRTHSGETSSSWVLDGFLHQIGQSNQIQNWMLSENIILKIVPMLNPDGVFIGNYRTGIIGDDFNRKFNSGKKQFYLQIFALKRLISHCKRQGIVQLFLDLHGHSILKNSFIYGPSQDFSSKFSMKSLPYHLFHNSKYFRFASCKFKSQKENIETARIYFQLKEGILTFTSQTSLGLYYSQCQTFQMLEQDYQQFGKSILHSMMDTSIKREIKIPQQTDYKSKQKPLQKHMTKVSQNSKKIQNKLKISTPKNNKDKVSLRLPTANKTIVPIEQLEINDKNFSFSQQINRQEQIYSSKNHQNNEKGMKQQAQKQKRPINFRRRSEIMKVPKSNLLQRIINKNKQEEIERKNSEEQTNWLGLGRSATFDTSETLKRQIDFANKNQEQSEAQYQFEMQPIDQNFSEDYVSMNDLDSQGQNLPEQERNYLFQYIKSNQHHIPAEEDLNSQHRNSEKQQKIGQGDSKEQKVSRFRQIRFKSIQEIYQCESKEPPRISIKKIKLQPHKFKDNVSKSLIYKYHQIVPHVELDDTNIITFSQQKRLNQRSQLHRTQKDPFILFQRKQKNQRFFEKQ